MQRVSGMNSPLQDFIEEDEVCVKRKAGQCLLTLRQSVIGAMTDGI